MKKSRGADYFFANFFHAFLYAIPGGNGYIGTDLNS